MELLKARVYLVFGEFFKRSSFEKLESFKPGERLPAYWQGKASDILETIINSNASRSDELALAHYWRATLYWLKNDGRLGLDERFELVESDLNAALDDLKQNSSNASTTDLNDVFIESKQNSFKAFETDIKLFRAFVRFQATKRRCVLGGPIAEEILADLENGTDNEFCLIKTACCFYLKRWKDCLDFCDEARSQEIKSIQTVAKFFLDGQDSPKNNSRPTILFFWNKYWILSPANEPLIVDGYRVSQGPESSSQRDFILESSENAKKFVAQIQKDGVPSDWVYDPPYADEEEEIAR